MCELLLMATSHSSADPYQEPRLFKAGDVVVGRNDNWAWGGEEIVSPMFIIFRVADMSVDEGQALSAEEPGDILTTPTLLIRQFKVDFSLLPVPVRPLIDGINRNATYIEISAAAVRAAKIKKEPYPDPMVIG